MQRCLNMNSTTTSCELQDFLNKGVSGTGLTFITFTEAIDHFGVLSPVFAVLFFLMLMSLGFGSIFGTIQGVQTSLHDVQLLKRVPKELVTVVICAMSFLMAQIFALSSGDYLLQIFDTWVGTVPLLILAFFEIIAISYFYGVRRFSEDIYMMCGEKPNRMFMLCWKFISPIAMCIILVAFLHNIFVNGITYSRYNKEIGEAEIAPMPPWAILLCIFLSTISLISIPAAALVHKVVKLPPVTPSWFPEDDLRAQHPIDSNFMSSQVDKLLFPY